MFKLFHGKKKDENIEQFVVNMVCPDRTLGLQIDGKNPPFKVRPVNSPSTDTEIKEGNLLVGIDDWIFDSKTDVSKVLDRIKNIMNGAQPVIKLLMQRDKGERPKPVGATWTCERCTVANAMNQQVCDVCGLKQEDSMKRLECKLEPNWKCSSCTYENAAEKKECLMCNAPKSTANAPKISEPGVASISRLDSDEQLDMALKMSMETAQEGVKEKPAEPVVAQPLVQQPIYQPISGPGAAHPMHAGIQVPYGQPVRMQHSQPHPYQQAGMMGYPAQGIGYMPQHQMPHPMHQQPMVRQAHVAPPVVQKAPTPEPAPVEKKEVTPEPLPVKPEPAWQCGLCTTRNKAEATTCTTCNAPRISKKKVSSNRIGPDLGGMNIQKRSRVWKCSYCAYENNAADNQCLMCSRDRPQRSSFLRADPKEALETADRQKIAMAWLQKQLILENHCRVSDLDAAFRRSDNRVTESVFRLTSGFKNLDMFKGKLERFVGGQVGSLKRMGDEMEGRLHNVTNELQKAAKRYQETTDFMNITQQELEEKIYLSPFTNKLDSLNTQEENLRKQLDDIQAQKDTVTLQMRSAAINKKLQFENCERVVKQLKDHLGFLRSEKNELDVQSEIIRQQVDNYTEMRRTLANVKLNDLKSTIRIFEQNQYATDYSGMANTTSPHHKPVQTADAQSGFFNLQATSNAQPVSTNVVPNNQSRPQLSADARSNPSPNIQPQQTTDVLDFFSELTQPNTGSRPAPESNDATGNQNQADILYLK